MVNLGQQLDRFQNYPKFQKCQSLKVIYWSKEEIVVSARCALEGTQPRSLLLPARQPRLFPLMCSEHQRHPNASMEYAHRLMETLCSIGSEPIVQVHIMEYHAIGQQTVFQTTFRMCPEHQPHPVTPKMRFKKTHLSCARAPKQSFNRKM